MSKAVITDHGFPSIQNQRGILEAAGCHLEEVKPICLTEEDVIRTCADADVLLVQWAPITSHVFRSLPRAKCVIRYGIGVDNIDLEGAKELGVRVANVPRYCLEEVSNHALAMMLSLARGIPQDHSCIMRGGWGLARPRIPALADLTLGLVGYGAIARRVSDKAKMFGLWIIAFDPFLTDSVFEQGGVEGVALDRLFRTADIISLHCPLLPTTKYMVNRKTIAMMKPGVLLVNTARGPLVREADLIAGLESGRIAGAGLDVFEEEPLPAGSPLRNFPNIILTSHVASVSVKASEMLQVKAAEAARDFLQGKLPEGTLV
jgi:D-3-phosphoglycerate dehydrogenase